MSEFVAAQASVLIVPSLGKGANSFATKLRAELERVRVSYDVEVKANTAKMIAEVEAAKAAVEAEPINLRVATDRSGIEELKRSLTEVRHRYDDVASRMRRGLVLNLQVAGLAQLQALVPALAAVNASIVELSQSALLLPGIMAGLISSISAAVIGSHGLADAFKAQSEATKDSAEASRRQVDANRAVKDATISLNAAIKDAKRNIEDLNDQLRDAPTDEAEALLDLQEAQFEANQKFGKSNYERQRDALRLRKSESALADVRKRNLRLQQDANEANAKGVSGADNVVSATDRLTKALETANAQTGSVKNLADAMAKLSPNTQDFVRQVQSLGPAWNELRLAVADRLFANLGGDVRALAAQDLPLLKSGLAGIAGAINGSIRTAMASLGSDASKGFLENIFGNTEKAQGIFDRAINPLIDGFLRLGSVGSNYLPRLSDAFGDVMARFDNFIARAQADGSLDKWIENGMKSLTEFGNSLINIGSIMNTVRDVFIGSGGKSFTQWLQDNTKRLADFLKGPEGQEKLTKMFKDARAELAKWEPTLKTLPGIFKNVKDAAMQWANMLLPFFNTVGPLLRDHPGLVTAIFTAYMTWRTVAPIISAIGIALDSGLVAAARRAMVAVGTGYRSGGLTGALGSLASLVSPGGIVMTGLTAVAGYLAYQYMEAQQDAANAAQHHADMVSLLKGNLDDLTGSLTQRGLIDGLKALGNWQNPDNHMAQANIPAAAEGLIGRDGLARAINPTDQAGRNDAKAKLRATVVEELNKGGTLASDGILQSQMKSGNFSMENLADALLGDPTQIDRFKKLGGPGGPGYTLSDIAFGWDSKLPFGVGDKPGLSERARNAVDVNRAIDEYVNEALKQGADTRANSQALAGAKADLLPGGPFSGLGSPRAFYHDTRDGGAKVEVDTPPDKLPASITSIPGVRIEPKANGSGSIIDLDPDQAKQFVIPGHALGGLQVGPGTGTSDSILARLSNGEYVIRAKAVQKYGPEFYDALNEGRIDPQDLPGFAGGGLIGFGGFKLGPDVAPPGVSDWVPSDGSRQSNSAPVGQVPSDGSRLPSPIPVAPGPAPGSDLPPRMPPPLKPISGSDLTNPGLYDPATGKISGGPTGSPWGPKPTSSPLVPGRDGDPGDTQGPNLPPTDPKSPFYVAPGSHLTGATTPGPGNSVSDALGPDAVGSPDAGDFLKGFSDLPDEVNPVNILTNIGEILLSAVLGFFGIDPTYFGIGKRIAQGFTKKKKPTEGNDEVDNILSGGRGILDTDKASSNYLSLASTRAGNMAELMAGKPYRWGGSGLDGTDCSGLVMYVADAYTGKPFAGRSGGTGGFQDTIPAKGGVIIADPSQAPPGTLRVGWNDHHTAGTLPDGRNFESSTFGQPIAVGPGAQGYDAGEFDHWAYFPAPAYADGGLVDLPRFDNGGQVETPKLPGNLSTYGTLGAWWLFNKGIRPSSEIGLNQGNPFLPFANGGLLSGAGTGRSDSMLARVSNGEFITRASSVAKYGRGFFDAINAGSIHPDMLPRFADGGMPLIPPTIGSAAKAATPSTPLANTTSGAGASAVAQPVQGGVDVSGIGSSATPGATGSDNAPNPRGALGVAPASQDHNNPALSAGIKGAWSTIGSLAATAASMAVAGASGGAGGMGGGAAGSGIQAAAQMGGEWGAGVMNILSSLLVGSAPGSNGTTPNAYGAPVMAQGPPQSQRSGPAIVNNYGDIHTADYGEFHRGQERMAAQQVAPLMPMR